jgi:hypothetical protein
VVEQADQLTQSLVDLVPCVDLSQFWLSQVKEDAEIPASLFDRQDNKALFKDYIDRVWAYLGHPHPQAVKINDNVKYDRPIFSHNDCWTSLKLVQCRSLLQPIFIQVTMHSIMLYWLMLNVIKRQHLGLNYIIHLFTKLLRISYYFHTSHQEIL